VHESDTQYDNVGDGYVRVAFGTADPDQWFNVTLVSGAAAAAPEDAAVADVNGDGHPDVVVASELAHLLYLQNPGRDARTVSWRSHIPTLTLNRGSFIRVFLADFDGDGRPEVATANKGAQNPQPGTQVRTAISVFKIDGDPLEEFSHRVASTWKLGRKGTDNGVLLLISLKDRKVRIEVGYGLEGTLTDLRSAHIIRNEIVPRFRTGDLPGGITAGTQAILGTIEGTYKADEVLPGHGRSSQEPTAFEYVIIGVIVGTLAGILLSHGLRHTRALLGSVLAFLVAQFASVGLGLAAAGVTALLLWLLLQTNRGGGRRGGWGDGFTTGPGGGFGGSFGDGGRFSGGGGSFGGGGASGDW